MNSVLDLVVGDRLMDEPPPITLLLACVRHYNTAAVSQYLRRGEEQLHGGWWVREARYGELGTTLDGNFRQGGTMRVLLSDSSADVQTGRDKGRREQHCHMEKGRREW